MNFRSSWFAVRNVLEYYFWFRSRLHFHARVGFIPLGGNTVFIRTNVLRQVGGWDAECLAEDCELGVRLSSLGAKTVVFYEPELITREEASFEWSDPVLTYNAARQTLMAVTALPYQDVVELNVPAIRRNAPSALNSWTRSIEPSVV